jgi:hypothetical protein
MRLEGTCIDVNEHPAPVCCCDRSEGWDALLPLSASRSVSVPLVLGSQIMVVLWNGLSCVAVTSNGTGQVPAFLSTVSGSLSSSRQRRARR